MAMTRHAVILAYGWAGLDAQNIADFRVRS